MSQSLLLLLLHLHSLTYNPCALIQDIKSLAMRSQLSLSLIALSFFSSVSLAKHIPPQNILWGSKGPAAATLVPVSKTKSTPAPVVEERDTVCTNSPTSRHCWQGGYSVADDFDNKWPTTGNTVTVSNPLHLHSSN